MVKEKLPNGVAEVSKWTRRNDEMDMGKNYQMDNGN